MMCGLGFAVKPVLTIDAKATEHILHRQGIGKLKHTDVACLWVQEEIPETASAQSQERRKSRRLGNETTQQNSDCEALSHVGMASSGDVLGLRFSSQLSGRQQVTMSRSQPAETRSNRSIYRICCSSSSSGHREVARDVKEAVALHCLG